MSRKCPVVLRQISELCFLCCRDCVGDSCVVGDSRWVGTYGVSVDLVALSHCAVQVIKFEDIMVRS